VITLREELPLRTTHVLFWVRFEAENGKTISETKTLEEIRRIVEKQPEYDEFDGRR